MFFKLNSRMLMASLAVLSVGPAAFAASSLLKDGSEYRILFTLPGDQTAPHINLGPGGGFIVTQDNTTDGDGLGIRARRINSDFSGARFSFQVNSDAAGDQANPQVAALGNGGAVFVWEGGNGSQPGIFARFMSPNSVFTSGDITIKNGATGPQSNPSVAVLPDDSVVVVWQGYGLDGNMFGVFGQRFSPTGQKLGAEFQVNQFSLFSQRSPVVASLGNNGFVVVWVSEEQRNENSVDVYGRIFSNNGQPKDREFRINTNDRLSGNPSVVGVGNNGFTVAWDEKDYKSDQSGFDVYARSYDGSGAPVTGLFKLNTFNPGDQWAPRIAAVGNKILAVWTSLGQDGFSHGIYGQVFNYSGELEGSEFRVNTTTVSQQKEPAIAWDGNNRIVVAWSSFGGGLASFDLFAQRYLLEAPSTLPAPTKPFVSALSQSSIIVSWPELLGVSIASYELYVDNGSSPIIATSGQQVISNSNWVPGSQHSIRLLYKLSDGRKSPLSEAVTVVTWGKDGNGDSLPDDWQTSFWGKQINWPSASSDVDGDGATNLEEFLAGTNPTSAASVLRTAINQTEQGWFIHWNTEPGNVYQVQTSVDLVVWQNQNSQRFSASDSDALPINPPNDVLYYRVIRMR